MSDIDKPNEQDQSTNTEQNNSEKVEKVNPEDSSLSLAPQPKLNKKVMKVILICFCCVMLIAVIIAFSPSSPGFGGKKKNDDMKKIAKAESPKFLSVNESDFQPVKEKSLEKQSPSEILDKKRAIQTYSTGMTNKTNENSNPNNPEYKEYNRNDQQKEKEVFVKTVSSGNQNVSYTNSSSSQDAENQVRKSAIFFPISQPSQTKETSSNKSSEAASYDNLSKQLSASTKTDYEKQNQQKDKDEWLASRKSDYFSYLDSVYIEPFNVSNEVKAGTIIPITMITAISSDLPGDIIAQIVSNVYDSITGQTLLLPKGSKVIGKYDSAVSYGQNRILMAWDRIIRPDGISINIKGMQGADLEGKSGMSDQVDNHLTAVLAATTMHSIFNLAVDTVTSWLSSNEFLNSLSSVLTKTDETTNEVTKKIVDKIVNQQPSINIRAGMRGNIIVSKDIILPSVDDQGGF